MRGVEASPYAHPYAHQGEQAPEDLQALVELSCARPRDPWADWIELAS